MIYDFPRYIITFYNLKNMETNGGNSYSLTFKEKLMDLHPIFFFFVNTAISLYIVFLLENEEN